MSFFDEPEETRTAPRTAPRRRRPTGGPRRPRPPVQQTILIRRIVLAAVLVIAVILIAVLVNSCEVNAHNSSLKDYNNSVASLNAQSVNTGVSFFNTLSGPTNDPPAISHALSAAASSGASELAKAKGLSAPDELKGAQQYFVNALQLRADGMGNIAGQIQTALNSQTSKQAINSIAAEMARFYASDVLYIDYAVPQIIGALRSAGISVGGLGGQQINSSQFLPSVDWLSPSNIATTLHVSQPQSTQPANVPPCACGHALLSVSVGGSALIAGSTSTVAASPPPTFTAVFTNDGQRTENNVKVTVKVQGAGLSATTVVPQTLPGHQYTAQIQLGSSPPKGSYTVTATVEHVPGETTFTHNSQSFQITFQ